MPAATETERTMTVGQQLRWWGIGLAVFVLLLWLLADALLPFLLGAAMAYLCDPLADRLERLGLSRLMATIAVTAGWLALAVLALLLIAPLLVDQVRNAIAGAPATFDTVRELTAQWLPAGDEPSQLRDVLESLKARVNEWSVSALKGLWSGSLAVVDFVALVVITPVVAFYLLYDWDRMIAAIDDLLPRQHRDTIHALSRDLDNVLAGFVRGQLSVCAILGTFYAISLSLVGLRFGFLIGAFAGMISFIPFVGSILGGLLSIGIAIAQFWNEPQFIAAVAAIFVTGQVTEGNFLTPKLVGGHVGLHPVWLMFALSAFGSLFGFAGMLVAVPAAAAIGVLSRFGLARYKEGVLYRGSGAWRRQHAAARREEAE